MKIKHHQNNNWQQVIDRVEKNPPLSSETAEYLRQYSKEFREDFGFKHDYEGTPGGAINSLEK